MKTQHARHCLTITAAALLALGGLTHAQTITTGVPGFISYQGRVLNNTGGLVGSGTPVNRTVIFRVWDHPSNTLTGNLIYSEQQTVTISEGEFSVLVGQGVATAGSQFGYSETAKKLADIATAFAGSTRYLGVTVDDGTAAVDNEITPRQQIVSSAFSFRSKFAETLGTSASTALTVVDSGNIGVGNTNPTAKLTITGANTSTSSSTPQLLVTDSVDPNERLRIGVDSTGNGTGFIQSFKEGTGAQNLLLNPAGGNVGIGLNPPTARLDVAGGIKATGTDGFTFNSGDMDGGLFSPSDGVLTFKTNNAERLRVDASGNFGIGTANPTNKLHIFGGNVIVQGASAGDSRGYSLQNSAGSERGTLGMAEATGAFSTDAVTGDVVLRATTGKLILQSGSGSSAITINSSNNVGIGIAPVHKFDVNFPGGGVAGFGDIAGSGPLGYVGTTASTVEITSRNSHDITFTAYPGEVKSELLRIKGSGNVGIGTTNPTAKLHVNGGIQVANDNNIAGLNALIGYNDLHLSGDPGTTDLFVSTGGSVGIGTVSPVAPLDVRGIATRTVVGNYFQKDAGNSINGMNGVQYISIKSEWYVEAFGFISVSDQRIKNIVRQSDARSDLDLIQKLKVTDYRMVDRVQQGETLHKGLIAQEVQKVIPEAVRKADGYIPSIYAAADEVLFDADAKTLSVTMGKSHELKVGDRVRLIGDDGTKELKVTEVIDAKCFTVGPIEAGMDRVFVYGKQVDDFLSVDYNRIFTTGISAMQQLKKEKDAEVGALRDENAQLRERLATLEAKEKERDTQLAAIEKLLRSAAKPAAVPVSLKKASGAE